MSISYASLQSEFPSINPAYFASYLAGKPATAGNITYFTALNAQKAQEASNIAKVGTPLAINQGNQGGTLMAVVAAPTGKAIAGPAQPAAAVVTPAAPVPTAASVPGNARPKRTPGRASRGGSGSSQSFGYTSRSSRNGRGANSGGGTQQPQAQQTYIPGLSLMTPQEAAQIQAGQNIANQQVGLGYYTRRGLGQYGGRAMPQRTPGRANRPGSSGSSSQSSGYSGRNGSGGYGGGGQQWQQPQTQQTYIPGLSITTPQDSAQIQYGQTAADYQAGYAPTSQSSSLAYQSYLAQLQQLQEAAASTATATAASVPMVTTTAVNPSWFTEQTIITGVPNWTFLAGGVVVLYTFMKRR